MPDVTFKPPSRTMRAVVTCGTLLFCFGMMYRASLIPGDTLAARELIVTCGTLAGFTISAYLLSVGWDAKLGK